MGNGAGTGRLFRSTAPAPAESLARFDPPGSDQDPPPPGCRLGWAAAGRGQGWAGAVLWAGPVLGGAEGWCRVPVGAVPPSVFFGAVRDRLSACSAPAK